jgi:hypothetical protein
MKKCPYCAEEIQDAAIVCRYCQRDLPPPPPSTIPGIVLDEHAATAAPVPPVSVARKTSPAAWGCLTIILLLLGFCGYVAVQPTTPGSSTSSTAPDPELPAKVSFTGTQFVVTNEGSAQWTDTKADVNGGILSDGFTLQIGTVEPGAKLTVGAMQFAKSDGTRFNPFQMKPQKFVLTATMNGKLAVYVGGWQ